MSRLFFALPLPEAALIALERAQHEAKPAAARLAPRWTRPEQMHVTLKFLGEQPDTALPGLRAALAARARAACPIEATLARVAAFGGQRARILVAELESQGGGLGQLAAGLEADAAELGVERETRPFVAHVTLARFRHPGDARAVIAAATLEPTAFRFTEACLYRSELSPAGSRYAVIERCPLGEV